VTAFAPLIASKNCADEDHQIARVDAGGIRCARRTEPERNEMWIEEIFLENFGGLKGFGLIIPNASMNVIVGPNEVGKSTIVEFVRSVFFGFKRRRGTANSYETPDGALRAGRITLHTKRAGRVRVERREQPGNKEGLVTVVDEQETALDLSSVPIMRQGIDRTSFEALFAFDVDRIRALDRDTLTGRIVGSALGSLRVNPVDVAQGVEEQLKRLTKKTTRDDSSLHALKSRIGEIEAQLRKLQEKPRHYARLKEELASVAARRREIFAEVRETEDELERITGLLRHLDAWRKVLHLDREMAALDDTRDFPANGVLRLEQALERRREAWESPREIAAKSAGLIRRIDELTPDSVLLNHGDAITALDAKARDLSSRPSEIEKIRARVAQATDNLDAEIAELGPEWDRKRVAGFDSSVVLARTVDGFTEQWVRIRDRIRELERSLEATDSSRDRLADRIAQRERAVAVLREESRAFLATGRRDLLAEWKDCEKSVQHLRAKLFDRNVLLQKLDLELRDAERAKLRIQREKARGWYWLTMALLGILLTSGAAWLVHASAGQSGPGQWATLFGGLVLAFATPMLLGLVALRERDFRDRARRDMATLRDKIAPISGEMNAAANQQSELMGAIRQRTAAMARIAGEVLGNPAAGRQDILDAEKRSSLAEEPHRRMLATEELLRHERAELLAQERERGEIRERLDRANREFDSMRTNWQTLLNEKGLDSTIEPVPAVELIRRAGVLKKQLRGVRDQSEILRGMHREWVEFINEVRALATRMERPNELDLSPLETVTRWRHGLREATEAIAEKQGLEERLSDLQMSLELEKGKIVKAEKKIASLLETAGVETEEEFREKGERHDCRAAIDQERRLLIETLISGLAAEDENALRAHMGAEDWREMARLRTDLQADALRLREEAETLAARNGSLDREIEALENEEETDRLFAAREELIACVNETVGTWTQLSLASGLLARTLERYESQKQPRIVRRSSEIFSTMTSGAFRRVILPMDRGSIVAEREDGTRIGETLLSRGTLEQLYLSLRLAHLEIDRPEEDSVPLIMDDVLVNFDADRARRTAEILTEFSRAVGMQVLYLTCHPHVADLFPADVPKIELGGEEIVVGSPVGIRATVGSTAQKAQPEGQAPQPV
jgi:uncharacterized protein YhaN